MDGYWPMSRISPALVPPLSMSASSGDGRPFKGMNATTVRRHMLSTGSSYWFHKVPTNFTVPEQWVERALDLYESPGRVATVQ